MPFLPPNQQHQSIEGSSNVKENNFKNIFKRENEKNP